MQGLGAPIGSVVAGSKEFIDKARRVRKQLGGGMRQAGILAAGGLYALENNVARLAEDHKHAKLLADAIRATTALKLSPDNVQSNIIFFEVCILVHDDIHSLIVHFR